MAKIKCAQWTPMDTWLHLERSIKIKRHVLHDTSSSNMMWKNLIAPSWIEWIGLNGDDSHPSVSSEPLIEDEEANQTIRPNFTYIYACSSTM